MPLNDRLFQLMEQLDDDELSHAWRLLGQSAKASDFSARRHDQKIEPLSEELRSAAGHSARNMFRGRHELSWRDILIDIADKLDLGLGDAATEVEIEDTLLDALSREAGRHAKAGADLAEMVNAAKIAMDQLAARCRRRAYTKGPHLGGIAMITMRFAFGPNYKKLVPVVLFIVSAARLHAAAKAV